MSLFGVRVDTSQPIDSTEYINKRNEVFEMFNELLRMEGNREIVFTMSVNEFSFDVTIGKVVSNNDDGQPDGLSFVYYLNDKDHFKKKTEESLRLDLSTLEILEKEAIDDMLSRFSYMFNRGMPRNTSILCECVFHTDTLASFRRDQLDMLGDKLELLVAHLAFYRMSNRDVARAIL